ncbi:MAG: GNAT family N-acetyltransferase [Chloroflexi bacterium]|nr:GNAT family N-acetyltransferase [Chloroflexota bacterium]
MATAGESVVIETMGPADLAEATAVVNRAFGHRPVPRPLPSDKRLKRERRLDPIHRTMLGRLPGQTLVARKEGRIVGVMRVVEWPRCQVSPRQGLAMLPALIGVVRWDWLRWLICRYVWWRHDPRRPHLHIDPLTVDTELQGRGIGSQLLRRFCELADGTSLPGYLETDTPDNVRLYQRFGFEVTGKATIMGRTDWFMWRPAGGQKPSTNTG